MTVPRSSGWTRTSRRWPRRESTMRTRTSSGWSTMPLTRCSSAGRSTSGARAGARTGLLLALGGRRRLGGCRSRCRSRCFGLLLGPGRGLLRRLGLGHARGGLGLGVVDRLAVDPLGGDQQRRGRGQSLELLPVAGLGQDRLHGLARLRADLQPVLDTVGVDLDPRGVLLRVVQAQVLDRPAVALGARVGDDDAVLRVADLAHPQKPDTYGHFVLAPGFVVSILARRALGKARSAARWTGGRPG